MRDHTRVNSRRDFIKDGLRAALLGGLVFSGLFLGWRGRGNSGITESCALDLPCRNCSKISRCDKSRALQERNKTTNSRSLT